MLNAIKISLFIQDNYPGGYKKYEEDGGMVLYIPPPADELVVLISDVMEVAFTDKLNKAFPKAHIEKGRNFEGESDKDIETLRDSVDNMLKDLDIPYAFNINPCAMILSLPSFSKDNPCIDGMKNVLKDLPGLIRAYILFSDGHIRVDGDKKAQDVLIAKVKATSTEDKPKRNNPIDEIDIGLVHTTLDMIKSVDDFINAI